MVINTVKSEKRIICDWHCAATLRVAIAFHLSACHIITQSLNRLQTHFQTMWSLLFPPGTTRFLRKLQESISIHYSMHVSQLLKTTRSFLKNTFYSADWVTLALLDSGLQTQHATIIWAPRKMIPKALQKPWTQSVENRWKQTMRHSIKYDYPSIYFLYTLTSVVGICWSKTAAQIEPRYRFAHTFRSHIHN